VNANRDTKKCRAKPYRRDIYENESAILRGSERFQAKHALGLDPGVDTGSHRENASNQESRYPFRFNRDGDLAFSSENAQKMLTALMPSEPNMR
jgi:hypothetical protein